MSQYQQSNWSSRVLGFCSRVFSPAGGDGKPRGGRLGERQPAEDRINTLLCASEHNLVCLLLCAEKESSVCSCHKLESQILSCTAAALCCPEERGPKAGTAGQERTCSGLARCAVTAFPGAARGLLPWERGLECTCRWLAGGSSSLRDLGDPTRHQDPLDIQVLGTVLGHPL